MGKIIAICGKICSGKSYYANEIKKKENAVILSIDEVTYDLLGSEQGKNYDTLYVKVKSYLMKKSVEFVNIGCNVILDWGFWTVMDRREITEYYRSYNIDVEWHYIDIDNKSWEKNMEERNKKVLAGKGGYNFYVDEGLKKKILEIWEEPNKNEIDIWYCFSKT